MNQLTDQIAGQRGDRGTGQASVLNSRTLNLPNIITCLRLVLAFILFGLISAGDRWLATAALFVFAASTDAVDGYLARRYHQITIFGRILDPFVDKVIVCGAFIFLLPLQGSPGSGVTAWMVIAIVGREMFVSSLRGILEQQGCDFSASFSGKVKMALQCVAVTICLLCLSPRGSYGWAVVVRDVVLWLTVGVTIWSGMVYAIRAAVLLRQPSPVLSAENRERPLAREPEAACGPCARGLSGGLLRPGLCRDTL